MKEVNVKNGLLECFGSGCISIPPKKLECVVNEVQYVPLRSCGVQSIKLHKLYTLDVFNK